MTGNFGSKAKNLELLSNAGFNVPKFYVVQSQNSKEMDKKEIKSRLMDEFEDWINENSFKSVAVRSSSTQEDTNEKSFAGQFKTILDVNNKNDYIDALARVFNSTQSVEYSKKIGKVHAIVQNFIEPDIAGVIFSVNPANGNNELVVNAARGRGTNVVDGHEVEQYYINRLDFSNFSIKGKSKSALLNKSQVKELSSITLKIETLFGSPQDIEWAIKDKVIYILQARPITSINHLRVWDSSNLAESFPGIVLPLTFSIAKRGYLLGYKAQAYSAGLTWYELESHHRTFDAMIGIFNGKLYYNLLNWYKFISLFPGSARNQKFLDDQIATQGEVVYQSPAQLSTAFRAKFVLRILYRTIFFNRELKRFYKRFSIFEQDMERMPKSGDTQLLILQYTHIEQSIIPQFGRTVDNDFFVMTYHGWLKKLLNKWLPNKPFERNNIIGSISGVLSAKQALSLYELAENFNKDQNARNLLQKSDYLALEEYLSGTELKSKVDQYIEIFGHRFAEDQKIEATNPTLEPNGVYELIKAYIQLDHSEIRERLLSSTTNTKAIEEKIKGQLNTTQKLIYKVLLNRLKHHLRLREKNRLLRGKVYGYMRDLFPKVGQALVDEGVLKDKSDVFYLQIEEIYQLLQGSLIANDLNIRIEKRRDAYTKFADIEMPERFITKGLPSLEKIEKINTVSNTSAKDKLDGLISSPGTIEGRVVVLSEPKIPNEPYDILVARHTDPGWTPLIALAKGVIVEHGGMLSHAAIVTRELGIPSIIGVKDITSILKTGMHVRINAQSSCVEILDK